MSEIASMSDIQPTETYRQGDLLFVRSSELPLDAEPGSPILALGETTGHKHRASEGLQVFKFKGRTFLQGSGQILHEEHGPITLPEGVWEMVRQREYQAGVRRAQPRMVMD